VVVEGDNQTKDKLLAELRKRREKSEQMGVVLYSFFRWAKN